MKETANMNPNVAGDDQLPHNLLPPPGYILFQNEVIYSSGSRKE